MTELDPAWPPTVTELAAAVRTGERTATWAVEQALAAIDARNDEVGAFVALDPTARSPPPSRSTRRSPGERTPVPSPACPSG